MRHENKFFMSRFILIELLSVVKDRLRVSPKRIESIICFFRLFRKREPKKELRRRVSKSRFFSVSAAWRQSFHQSLGSFLYSAITAWMPAISSKKFFRTWEFSEICPIYSSYRNVKMQNSKPKGLYPLVPSHCDWEIRRYPIGGNFLWTFKSKNSQKFTAAAITK